MEPYLFIEMFDRKDVRKTPPLQEPHQRTAYLGTHEVAQLNFGCGRLDEAQFQHVAEYPDRLVALIQAGRVEIDLLHACHDFQRRVEVRETLRVLVDRELHHFRGDQGRLALAVHAQHVPGD